MSYLFIRDGKLALRDGKLKVSASSPAENCCCNAITCDNFCLPFTDGETVQITVAGVTGPDSAFNGTFICTHNELSGPCLWDVFLYEPSSSSTAITYRVSLFMTPCSPGPDNCLALWVDAIDIGGTHVCVWKLDPMEYLAPPIGSPATPIDCEEYVGRTMVRTTGLGGWGAATVTWSWI